MKDFLKCGAAGWCMEIRFTSLVSLASGDRRLVGKTSLFMFPIYGMAFLLAPLSRRLRGRSIWFRGCVYTGAIFLTEYVSGSFLKKLGVCPWDYSRAKWNVDGVIRLDYAPVWFLTGLLYEKLLHKFTAS